MKKIRKLTLILVTFSVLCWGAASVQPACATSFHYITPTGSSTSDGPVKAAAFFTLDPSTHQIALTLTDYLQNPRADGQLISGIMFVVSGTGSGSLTTSNSGNISTISSGGSYTTPVSDALTRWTVSSSSTTIYLTTLSGGKPNSLIIGPDSAGGFSGAGLYNNANSSIIQHNPSVLGTAIFDITVPWLTATSMLSDVYFKFGTVNDKTTDMVQGVHTPLPSTVLLLGSGILGMGLVGWRRRVRS